MLLPLVQSPPPPLRSPGQDEFRHLDRDADQAHHQEQAVDHESRDAEIPEELSAPLLRDQDADPLAVGADVGQAESQSDGGLD